MNKYLNKIIQGDCLEVMKTFKDKEFDVVITDPPYGIGISKNGTVGGGSKRGNAKDFGKSDWDNNIPTKEYFDEMIRISKNQIIFGGNYFIEYLTNSPCWLVWDKRGGVMPTRTFADGEIAWTSFKSPLRIFRFIWDGMIQENMKNKEKRWHPTQKPLPLMKWIIENYTQPTDKILDPYMGSGSTLVASKELNRDCVGIEISPEYCKIAEDGLRQETLLT